MCSACRFCLSVYLDLSPRGIVHLLIRSSAKPMPRDVIAALFRRIEGSEVRNDIDDVVVRQARNGLLHQRGVAAISAAILEHVELTRKVRGVTACEPRHVSKAVQCVAVANRALD